MTNIKNFARICVIAAGIAAVAPQAHAVNLIVNGDFGTGDFSGWTASANSYPMYIVAAPTEGGSAYAAQIAGYTFNPDTLSQVVSDTSGQSYTLSFWVYQSPPNLTASDTSFNVDWNGTVFTQPIPSGIGYQNYTVTVTGTGLDNLTFVAANNPGFTYLDNVSLSTGVPEPSTWAMMLAGFAGLGFAGYRRNALRAG
jgi:hypothetical protein